MDAQANTKLMKVFPKDLLDRLRILDQSIELLKEDPLITADTFLGLSHELSEYHNQIITVSDLVLNRTRAILDLPSSKATKPSGIDATLFFGNALKGVLQKLRGLSDGIGAVHGRMAEISEELDE
ncbi:MAG: hypothetical protein Q9166_007665 [cf. Caloplaca sp. 2 TL-2023]